VTRFLLWLSGFGETPTAVADSPRPISRFAVLTIMTPSAAWLAFMTLLQAIAQGGWERKLESAWRIAAYKDVSTAMFGVALLTGAAALVLVEARGRRL
jgi:hypothetical protein